MMIMMMMMIRNAYLRVNQKTKKQGIQILYYNIPSLPTSLQNNKLSAK